MDVNFISLIVAVVLLVVDLFLVGYIKKKRIFFNSSWFKNKQAFGYSSYNCFSLHYLY